MVLPHAGPHRPTPRGTDRGYLLRWDLRDGSRLAKVAAHDGYVAISTHPPQALLSIGGQDHSTVSFHDLDGCGAPTPQPYPRHLGGRGWTQPGRTTSCGNGRRRRPEARPPNARVTGRRSRALQRPRVPRRAPVVGQERRSGWGPRRRRGAGVRPCRYCRRRRKRRSTARSHRPRRD
jgi:hypothetical protein